MKKLAIVLLVFAVALGGFRFWQEAHFGSGEVVAVESGNDDARQVAFVANSVGGSVSLIDIAQQEVIGTFSVIPDGTKVGFFRDPLQFLAQSYVEQRAGLNYAQDSDLSPDGRTLYVSRGLLGDVAAFDIATGKIIWRTSIAGLRADHMDISPDGARLYVSAILYGGDKVQVLDTADGSVVGGIGTGNWPHDVHVSGDGRTVYVASIGDMTSELAERNADPNSYLLAIAEAGKDAQTLRFNNGIRPFQIGSNGRFLFGQQSNTHEIFVHDIAADREIARLKLPVKAGVTEADWDFEAPHHGLALTSDGRTLCAAGRASDYAALVDAQPLALRSTIPVGDAPSWSAIDDADRYCLLANTRSDDVSIIEIASQSEVARLPVGRGPKHITIGRVPMSVLDALRAKRP